MQHKQRILVATEPLYRNDNVWMTKWWWQCGNDNVEWLCGNVGTVMLEWQCGSYNRYCNVRRGEGEEGSIQW